MKEQDIRRIVQSKGKYLFVLNNIDPDFDKGVAVMKVVQIRPHSGASTLLLEGKLVPPSMVSHPLSIYNMAIDAIIPLDQIGDLLK